MGTKGKKLLDGVAGGVPGIAIGKVRVVNSDEAKLVKLEAGEILVGDGFEKKHDAYLQKALAIISNVGAMGAHVNVFARDNGKISVTGTLGMADAKEATRELHDGQIVLIEGHSTSIFGKRSDGTTYEKKYGAVYEYNPDPGEIIPSVKTETAKPAAATPLPAAPAATPEKFDLAVFVAEYKEKKAKKA